MPGELFPGTYAGTALSLTNPRRAVPRSEQGLVAGEYVVQVSRISGKSGFDNARCDKLLGASGYPDRRAFASKLIGPRWTWVRATKSSRCSRVYVLDHGDSSFGESLSLRHMPWTATTLTGSSGSFISSRTILLSSLA